jgi:ribosomal-protein-alanine N-acetyltransferase
MSKNSVKNLIISRLTTEDQARQCATLMAQSEPWITLRRDYQIALKMIQDPSREVYVALIDERVAGLVILFMHGPFRGYIQTVGVLPQWRDQGVGTKLIAFAEARIFREAPNVFMCVSSFNEKAKRLYERLGYEVVGALKEFIVPGHSEILLRKTSGPWSEFRKSKQNATAHQLRR